MPINRDDAANVVRMTQEDGFKVIKAWIDSRIETLTGKILSGESDVSVASVNKQKLGKTLDITTVCLLKDSDRHEIRTWKLLFSKLKECEDIAFKK